MHLPKIADLNYKAQRVRFEQMLKAEIVPYFKENSSLWKKKEQIVCTISYAWGNKEQEDLIAELAEVLEHAGLTILIDRWYDRSGLELSAFIKKMFGSDYILVIGTPLYLQKCGEVQPIKNSGQLSPYFSELTPSSNEHVLSIEMRIISHLVIHSEQVSNRIIPLLWEGTKETALPFLLRGKLFRDFVTGQDSHYFEQVLVLLKDLYSINNRDKKYQEFLNNLNVAVKAIEIKVLSVKDQYEAQQQQGRDEKGKQAMQTASAIIADLVSSSSTKRLREKELDDSPDDKRRKNAANVNPLEIDAPPKDGQAEKQSIEESSKNSSIIPEKESLLKEKANLIKKYAKENQEKVVLNDMLFLDYCEREKFNLGSSKNHLADCERVNVCSANLKFSIFNNISFRFANFREADIEKASFKGANISCADFTWVKNMSEIQLLEAADFHGIQIEMSDNANRQMLEKVNAKQKGNLGQEYNNLKNENGSLEIKKENMRKSCCVM